MKFYGPVTWLERVLLMLLAACCVAEFWIAWHMWSVLYGH